MKPVKFYRVATLPEVGEVGSLYFVSGSENYGLWVCTGPISFEAYTPQQYVESETLEKTVQQGLEVQGDTLIIHDEDIATIQNGILKTSPLFAKVNGDTLIYNNYESN